MAQPLSPVQLREFSSGVIRGVSEALVPSNSVRHAINFLFDEETGNAVLRSGLTILDSQLISEDNNILGLYDFRRRSDSNHRLMAAVNEPLDGTSSIYEYDGSSWGSSLTSLTPDLTYRFESFLETLTFQNGTDAPQSFNGSTWSNSGGALDIGNIPTGIDVLNYQDRMHVLTIGGLLYRSGLPSSPGYNTISWTSGNDLIVIDPDNTTVGNAIGMTKLSGLMLIFKERGIYTFNGSATQADLLTDVGCSSVHSIATGGGLCFFFNPEGIWMTNGGFPIRISDFVRPYIDGMSSAFYGSVSGYTDGRYYWCSIGNSTIGTTTYSNVVLRYSILSKEWAVLSYANRPMTMARYIDGNDVTTVIGDSTARVLTLDSGLTDNGTAIPFELETQDLEFGSRGIIKEIHDRIMVYSENAPEMIIQIQIDGGDWKTIGTAKTIITDLTLSETIRGHFFRLRTIGGSSTVAMMFQGFEFPKVTLQRYGT